MNTELLFQIGILNVVMGINIMNIIFNWKKTWLPTFNAIILIVTIFLTVDFNIFGIDSKVLLLATISSSLLGPLMESIILHFTNEGSWKYGNPSFNWYVPLDLLPGYGLLGLGFITNYFIIKNYIGS